MMLTPRKGLLIAITLMFSQVCFATVTERTDKLGPEYDGVEVIADTGYGNTLFDSADNKCQHCHNDFTIPGKPPCTPSHGKIRSSSQSTRTS